MRRKDIDGSESVPGFYGKELRWKREQAGLTLQQLAEGSFYGLSHLSEIERGQRRMPPDLAEHVDRVLKTDGFFARRCEEVRKAKVRGHADYYAEVLELEERAQDIEEWMPDVIPGPLQLEPYIRAVIHATYPSEPAEQTAEKVSARRERAWLFEDSGSPETWLVMSELVLLRPILGADEMAEQLAHVVEVAQRRRFIPQILPWNVGAHPFTMGTTRLLTFNDAPPIMYTEGMYSGQVIDDPSTVRQYAKAYDRLRAAALPSDVSLKMIERAAEDYRNGKRPRGLEPGQVAQEQPQQR
ncbi:helix-turn-helix transcriptional regulator [Streptomyces sp. PSKA30]|uniref:helix-turn-helix domain-containing protein n=1 Tax=Streptomyces sp. PSKA30 TaxID=2874597 RepID=UPI001CD06BD0|nr:helix-turn-helix transcriptional regulator [Streptomyces sp. PSKA30]MBZ9638263.1 helix-turn-helix transcriptional regulator [Streptomyces sp. PSKA30]